MQSVERIRFSFYTGEIIDPPVAVGLRTRMSFSAYVQLQFRKDSENAAHSPNAQRCSETHPIMDRIFTAEDCYFFTSYSASMIVGFKARRDSSNPQ